MANKELVDYLKEGQNRGFSLEFLKQKLLGAGFDQKEVNEAADLINNKSKNGVKWMKIAGIIGIIYLIISILLTLTYFIPSFPQINDAIILICGGIIFISVFFYYAGIIKLGRKTNSKLISFYAWFIMVSLILIILVVVLSWSYIGSQLANSENLVNGLNLSPIDSQNNLLSWIFGIIYLALILFYFIIGILFSIGLIKIKDNVKFSKAAGIFNLISIIITLIALLIGAIILIFYPFILTTIFLNFAFGTIDWRIILFIAIGIIDYISKALFSLFLSLSLFDASKKFE